MFSGNGGLIGVPRTACWLVTGQRFVAAGKGILGGDHRALVGEEGHAFTVPPRPRALQGVRSLRACAQQRSPTAPWRWPSIPIRSPAPARCSCACAAGINGADILQRKGAYPAPPGSPPDIPGLELAGEVVELGPSAARFDVGDAVMAIAGGGGQAELAVVHERQLMPVPDRGARRRRRDSRGLHDRA